MNEMSNWAGAEAGALGDSPSKASRRKAWPWVLGAVLAAAIGGAVWYSDSCRGGGQVAAAATPPPSVTVSQPLVREVDTRLGFLGQFSAVNRIELRAQVGGTLTELH